MSYLLFAEYVARAEARCDELELLIVKHFGLSSFELALHQYVYALIVVRGEEAGERAPKMLAHAIRLLQSRETPSLYDLEVAEVHARLAELYAVIL